MTVSPLARTLDQELLALVRGASLECLVCGEFMMRFTHAIACPECRSILADGVSVPELELPLVAVESVSSGQNTSGPRPLAVLRSTIVPGIDPSRRSCCR